MASKICSYAWRLDAQEKHIKRKNGQKAAIDNTPPPVYPHLIYRSKKEQMLEERCSKIEYENRMLLKKNDRHDEAQTQDWRDSVPSPQS